VALRGLDARRQAEIENIRTMGQARLASQGEIEAQVDAQRARNELEDALNMRNQPLNAGMKAYFRELVDQADYAAKRTRDVFASAFDSLNDNLAKTLTGQKANWQQFFQQLGEQLTKLSLVNLEDMLAKKISIAMGGGAQRRPWDEQIPGGTSGTPRGGVTGSLEKLGQILFGKGNAHHDLVTPDGSEMNPLWVRVAQGGALPLPTTERKIPNLPGSSLGMRDGQSPGTAWFVTLTNAASGPNGWQQAGSIVSSLAPLAGAGGGGGGGGGEGTTTETMGVPAKALGGDVYPERPYLVGEHGPELFTPAARGRITPSNEFAGPSTHLYIDARGTDPLMVEQRVRMAMGITHNSAVRTSFQSVAEHRMRTPQKA
jgi:hypothetical protein